MRMVWLGIAALSLLVALVAHTSGLLALSLLTLTVSAFGFVISTVQARIEDRSRPEEYLASATDLLREQRVQPPRAAAKPPVEPDEP